MFLQREKTIVAATVAAVLAVAALGVTAFHLSRQQRQVQIAERRARLQRDAESTAALLRAALRQRLTEAERAAEDPLIARRFLTDRAGKLILPDAYSLWGKRFRLIFLDPAPAADDGGFTMLPAPPAAPKSEAAPQPELQSMVNMVYDSAEAPEAAPRQEKTVRLNQMMYDSAETTKAAAVKQRKITGAPAPLGTEREHVEAVRRIETAPAAAEAAAEPETAPEPAPTRFQRAIAGRDAGFFPATVGGRFSLLVWHRAEGMIRGFEVEGRKLLDEAAQAIPPLPPGERMTICDAVGTVWLTTGNAGDAPTAAASLPLDPELLPGVRLEAHFDADRIGREAVVPLALAVAALLAAVLFAGGLLFWLVRRELREARTRGNFVSQVSHEFKTPLTAIRMYAELLRDHPKLPKEKRLRYLATMEEECARLNRMVENVLDFNRIADRRKHYRVERFDLAGWLREDLPRFAAPVEAAGMALEAEIPEGPLDIRYDRDALTAILENLIGNAVKYAAAGGKVVLTLDAKARELHCRDLGPGVPEALREKVFDRFFRADDALTAAAGFGLGLAIARDAARALGGDLVCRPAEPGADFVLLLPKEETT